MGWLLLGKPGKKKPKVRKSATPVKTWDPQRTLAALNALGVIVLLCIVVVGWQGAERKLGEYVEARRRGDVRSERVALVNAPTWLGKSVLDQFRSTVSAELSASPLDNDGLQRAARLLGDNPWVSKIESVRRLPSGEIAVSARYREPVAMAETGKGWCLVDSDGVRLPGLYRRTEAVRIGLPMVTGVKSEPRDEGQVWPAEDLKAGLSVVSLLRTEPYASQIELFDVSERDARGRVRISLKTRRGEVRWGLPPGEERSVEPEASVKKQWIATVYKRRGAIDAGGRVVDVYGAEPFIHQTVETQEANASTTYNTWDR